MTLQILIIGGAGFIGSHLADALLDAGHEVRVLDGLVAQVHGATGEPPAYMAPEVDIVQGDVRDVTSVRRALAGVDAVYHFAAAVGVGQSMYEMRHYAEVNTVGTAVLLEALAQRPADRLVVASSMSIYDEGLYRDHDGDLVESVSRNPALLQDRVWDPLDTEGRPLESIATPEWKRPDLRSVYALTKYDQERLCLLFGEAHGVPTTALRFFNVYGPRQALSNPYTGVLAIFASRIMNGKPPLVFEDGEQQRDFVSVHDVVQACMSALDRPESAGLAINVGSGKPRSVRDVAETMLRRLGRESLGVDVTGTLRMGDVRHCHADISCAREVLDYRPAVAFEEGVRELVDWLATQRAQDHTEMARQELVKRRLVR